MTSKFSGLLQAKQAQSPIVEDKVSEEPQSGITEDMTPDQPVMPVEQPTADPVVASEPAPIEQPKVEPAVASAPAEIENVAAGKAMNMQPLRGKKGHPDYNQVTIYLKKETQNNAKISLLQARDNRDFSELVEDLLTDWLAAQK